MLKINKLTVIGITATIILTFFAGISGFFEFTFTHHYHIILNIIMRSFGTFTILIHLYSAVLMLGICLGIISTFVKTKRKILFYGSILTIILGGIVGVVDRGPIRPVVGTILEPGTIFITVLSNNLFVAFLAILSGPTIIYPYIVLGTNIIFHLDYIAGNIIFHGLEGVILWVGLFHAYPELYALYLACISGIKISLRSFKAYISIRRNGVKNTLKTIERVMIHELRSTAPKVVILLIIAALLQAFWTPFWINYWLQHIA